MKACRVLPIAKAPQPNRHVARSAETRAIASLNGGDPDDETLRLRVTTIIAPIMAFRTNRQALLDRFHWPSLTPERIAKLETVILEAVRNNFLNLPPGIAMEG